MKRRLPHIVIFNPDQWRGDVLGHMGNPAAVTPHLDQAASTDFVSFRNAFCQNPVCTPSRCSFMTGWYPHVRGHRTMHHMLQPDEPMLLRTLKRAGYYVWWGGKNDVVPAQNGFRDYCDVKYTPPPAPPRDMTWRGKPGSDTWYSFFMGKLNGPHGEHLDSDWGNVKGAINLIRNAPADKPLCIYLPLSFPHPPYGVEEPFFSMIDRQRLPARPRPPHDWREKPALLRGLAERQNMSNWSEERWTELRATYYAMCARVDHQFGLLLQVLKEANVYDDSAVFFFSDHGDFTGDYGLVEKTQNTFEDCLTRVPFLVKLPKSMPVKPRACDALVELIDFPATVHDLLNLNPGYSMFGRSLLPLLAGETDAHRDAVFCEGGRLPHESHCSERQSQSSLEATGMYWPRLSLQQSDGPEHTKAVMCRTPRYKYVRRLDESDELYDLQADPAELHNRINDPTLSVTLLQLKDRLLTHFLQTADVVPWTPDQR